VRREVLNDISILVVEDEPFVALEIAMEIEDAGGSVIGPAPSVAAAIELLKKEEVHGAILDVHLADGDVGPVVTQLSRLGVPFRSHCGGGLTPALEAAYPNVEVYRKPTRSTSLIKALASLVQTCGAIGI
jgi:CheY-like chemotaxis protein